MDIIERVLTNGMAWNHMYDRKILETLTVWKVVQFVDYNDVIVLPSLTSQGFPNAGPRPPKLVLSITCRLPQSAQSSSASCHFPDHPLVAPRMHQKCPKYFCLIFLPQQIKEFLWTVNCGSPKSGQNKTRAAPGRQGTGSSIEPPIMTMLIAAHADFLPLLMMF